MKPCWNNSRASGRLKQFSASWTIVGNEKNLLKSRNRNHKSFLTRFSCRSASEHSSLARAIKEKWKCIKSNFDSWIGRRNSAATRRSALIDSASDDGCMRGVAASRGSKCHRSWLNKFENSALLSTHEASDWSRLASKVTEKCSHVFCWSLLLSIDFHRELLLIARFIRVSHETSRLLVEMKIYNETSWAFNRKFHRSFNAFWSPHTTRCWHAVDAAASVLPTMILCCILLFSRWWFFCQFQSFINSTALSASAHKLLLSKLSVWVAHCLPCHPAAS